LDCEARVTLRSMPVSAPSNLVAQALSALEYPFAGKNDDRRDASARIQPVDAFTFKGGLGSEILLLMLQPVEVARTVIHGTVGLPSIVGDRLGILRHYHHVLSELRRQIENWDERPEGLLCLPLPTHFDFSTAPFFGAPKRSAKGRADDPAA
jgi:hypothetical protein